ncbi:MAG: acyl carrier protein [Bacteroidales bacterium]|nr:acyl carrier protein [Bacteroidales bacterium]
MDIKAQLTEIIQDYVDFPASEIDPQMPLKEVAALDSFVLIELIASIEDRFCISIPNEDVKDFKTLNDMIKYLEKKLA